MIFLLQQGFVSFNNGQSLIPYSVQISVKGQDAVAQQVSRLGSLQSSFLMRGHRCGLLKAENRY
jgi:hypothetical protein